MVLGDAGVPVGRIQSLSVAPRSSVLTIVIGRHQRSPPGRTVAGTVSAGAVSAVVGGAVVGCAVVGGAVSAGAVSAAAQERDRHAAGSPGLGLALCHAVDLSVGRNQWRA